MAIEQLSTYRKGGSIIEKNEQLMVTDIANLISSVNSGTTNLVSVYDNLHADNIDSNTHAILEYGVNIFTLATATDYAAKLPQPTTGKTTIIVNNTTSLISLYPSNIGGRINNYPIDTPAVIPPDGKSYSFICVENPLPGEWVWAAPATGQIVIGNISINHVQGVASGGYGYSDATITPSATAALDGAFANIVLTGNWLTENVPTTLINMKTYSNIIPSDLNSDFIPDAVQISLYQAYKPTGTTISSVQQIQPMFGGYTYYDGPFSPTGTLNVPLEIGDTGTFYSILPVAVGNNGQTDQLGVGGQYSRGFYTFSFGIPASAITKIYKFRIILEVLQ